MKRLVDSVASFREAREVETHPLGKASSDLEGEQLQWGYRGAVGVRSD